MRPILIESDLHESSASAVLRLCSFFELSRKYHTAGVKTRCLKQSMPPKSTQFPAKMDSDSCPLNRLPPQQSGSAKKTAGMPTPSTRSSATTIGANPPSTSIQRPHNAVTDGISTEKKSAHANLPTSSSLTTLPCHGGPSTATTQIQSNQADSGILHSDAYLSARKLLAATREPDACQRSPKSVAADAAVAHLHFSELLTRLVIDISAGGHDDLLPDAMLPGLAHLVGLVEQTCSASTNATSSTTEPTTASLETTIFTFRSSSINSSASSTPDSNAASKSTDAVQETTAPAASPKTITLALRSHPINSSTSSTTLSSSTVQEFRFLSLPHDAKIRTLSFVPEINIALNCRLVCHEFCDFIDGNEPHIAQLVMERELSRLQAQINMRRQMVPTNLTDFVFDASLWVHLRGFCPGDPDITLDSFTAWRLSPNRHRDMIKQGIRVQPHKLAVWGILAENLLRLQLDLHKDVDVHGEKQVSTLRDYAAPTSADCSKATLLEYQRLCFMIWERPVSKPFFSGQEHDHARGERGTFPKLRLSKASYG